MPTHNNCPYDHLLQQTTHLITITTTIKPTTTTLTHNNYFNTNQNKMVRNDHLTN